MLGRLFKYWVKNILRNKFLSFSSILVLILLMFFVNILMVMHNLSNTLIDSINSKLTISLYLKDEYNSQHPDVVKLMNDVEKKLPNIDLEYLSKDAALENMRKKSEELVNIVKSINPLPATINLSNIKIDQYEKLNEIIESKMYLLTEFKSKSSSNVEYRNQYNRILKIISILKTLKVALYIIIFIFLMSIFIITYSIIWNFIYHYRDEIYITKLVWGSNIFIYWPFVFQGLIYSVLSFLLSFLLYIVLLNNIWYIFQKDLIKSYVLNLEMNYLYVVQLFVFIIIWMFSSYLSSKKYIKN